MNSVVILRAVRDPASFTVNRRAEKIFIHREQFICNPADLNALEAALRLDGAVTAVAYGGAEAEEALRMALALGATRAVLAEGVGLHIADAGHIVEAVRRALDVCEATDVVLLGDEVLDGDTAQAGPRLAEALGWPFVESAWQVEAADGRVKAIVRRGRGYHALAAALPAVVSVARDSNRVRYAPAGRVVTYFRKAGAVEKVPASAGAENAPPCSTVTGEALPPERKLGVVMDGALPETLAALAASLRAARDGG